MAKRGIDNVLGNLLGPVEPEKLPETSPVASPAPAEEPQLPAPPIPEAESKGISTRQARVPRRGRPPGSRAGEGKNKVKKTFAIDQELYQACVSRSWKEEMQMGEVIEKALRLYLKTPIKLSKE